MRIHLFSAAAALPIRLIWAGERLSSTITRSPARRSSGYSNNTIFPVVAEAGDGEEAIERARELQPDIVLLDLTMPA